MEKKENRGSFTGSLGFVLAAAGSAVGLGNIWRFPYLAAKDGGGLFLLVYLILVVTVGFTLLTTDIAIGRKTKKHAWEAFGFICPKWGFLGKITFLVPAMIMTYYTVIGGWVIKPTWIDQEMESSGHSFPRKKLYAVMIRFVAPVLMAILFVTSTGIL